MGQLQGGHIVVEWQQFETKNGSKNSVLSTWKMTFLFLLHSKNWHQINQICTQNCWQTDGKKE